MIQRVPQRGKNDCGVACVAMLAGVTYEEALAHLPTRRTSAEDCIRALRKLGKRVGQFYSMGPNSVETLKFPSLLKVNRKRKTWHWVVYDPETQRIIDPSYPEPYTVLAYLQVKS